ncbi:hypothetical protein ABZ070_32010 [Streptomyces sp. NPDC006283]|uniref:hypothetical protein n=1 Tax=Streptomyces sp. NPDC006283 TaxID=3156741 RepID=UPI0033A55088
MSEFPSLAALDRLHNDLVVGELGVVSSAWTVIVLIGIWRSAGSAGGAEEPQVDGEAGGRRP